jgi:hypothetical protein
MTHTLSALQRMMGRKKMPVAFYFPEHWNAVLGNARPRRRWYGSLGALLGLH